MGWFTASTALYAGGDGRGTGVATEANDMPWWWWRANGGGGGGVALPLLLAVVVVVFAVVLVIVKNGNDDEPAATPKAAAAAAEHAGLTGVYADGVRANELAKAEPDEVPW